MSAIFTDKRKTDRRNKTGHWLGSLLPYFIKNRQGTDRRVIGIVDRSTSTKRPIYPVLNIINNKDNCFDDNAAFSERIRKTYYKVISQACNQCLCGGSIPARGTRYVAPYKRDFRRGSRTGGFLRVLRYPPPSKGSYSPSVLDRRDTVAAVLSPGRVARISQGNLWRKCYKIKKKVVSWVWACMTKRGWGCVRKLVGQRWTSSNSVDMKMAMLIWHNLIT
jgi:hypothetical protein